MKITVATVVRNAAPLIGRTVESVARQTYRNVEHLVIDGASEDGTADVCRKAGCRVVSEPDHGLYDAMNKALRIATGDYIVFLNAGDTLADEGVLERVVRAVYGSFGPDGGADVVYGETDIVDAEGRFVRHRRLPVPVRLTWRSFKHGMVVCHQAFYVRTALARLAPYDTRWRYSADYDWCIRVMRPSRVLVRAEGVLANFMQGGMTTAHHKASLVERLRIMARHYGWCTAAAMHVWFVVRAVVRR